MVWHKEGRSVGMYDREVSKWEFTAGDKALVLLPRKLCNWLVADCEAKWVS